MKEFVQWNNFVGWKDFRLSSLESETARSNPLLTKLSKGSKVFCFQNRSLSERIVVQGRQEEVIKLNFSEIISAVYQYPVYL